jgi:hypothetical protein
MEHGRPTGWTGRPRPRSRVRSPQGFAPVLQPGARLTGGSDFGSLPTMPTSSWRHMLERSSREISGISNRFWAKNRTCRKQTIKPLLTGSRFAYKFFEIRQVFSQNLAPENLRKTPGFSDFSAFLPGSAQKVESDVTYSKQTTAPFLPGATTAQCRLAAQPKNRHLNPIFRSLRMPLIALIEGGKL